MKEGLHEPRLFIGWQSVKEPKPVQKREDIDQHEKYRQLEPDGRRARFKKMTEDFERLRFPFFGKFRASRNEALLNRKKRAFLVRGHPSHDNPFCAGAQMIARVR
jgi:hypothetical protein